MGFPPSFFDHFQDRLELAVYDTNQEYRMGLKLQGLAAKVAKLDHDAEFEAAKLDAKVEGLSAKLPDVFSGAHGSVDKLANTIGDVENSFKALQSVSNGAPVDAAPPATPQPPEPPPVPLAPGAPSQTL